MPALLPAAPALPSERPAPPAGLRLFDGLAPFFVGHGDGAVNWSKIPFARLERDGALDEATVETVLREFDGHVAKMTEIGYDAVALDDLAHLVSHFFYPEPLQRKLAAYARLYARLFAIARARGLKIFAITDYLFYNGAIDRHLRARGVSPVDFFAETVDAAFAAFPTLDGVVLRIGESDGVDVEADFTSRLTIQRPREARALLERVLPIFAARGTTLVFRTWTLGAYPIGDLMWNRRTYDAVFNGIDSPNLVVSLKYGDADFFRYLATNPLFFHGPQRKIVELQCRREYEGMGEFPSFVGWSYAAHLATLRERASNLVGIYAIQAGGWAPFARLAYCANASIWNELNAFVTVKLFAAGADASVAAIVAEFCRDKGIADVDPFLRLLVLADEAIEEGLYVREFAGRPLYFRRVRVPPLTWVFWHNVTAGGLVGALVRALVRDPAAAVAEGHAAVIKVAEMRRLAAALGLPDDGLRFQLDTFAILALLREVLFGLDSAATRERIESAVTDYGRRYPAGYRFDYAVDPTRRAQPGPRLIRLLVRDRMAYRRSDRLMLNRHVTRLKALVVRRLSADLPRFVDTQGMTTDALLR